MERLLFAGHDYIRLKFCDNGTPALVGENSRQRYRRLSAATQGKPVK
jgi:hypothetical protein